MPSKRPYGQWFDNTLDIPVQAQVDDPAGLQFIPTAASNKRNIQGSDSNVYMVADHAMNPRGAKNIIWSSEGFSYNGVTIPAVTTAAKKVTGAATGTGSNFALATYVSPMVAPTVLDLSPYRSISIMINLSAITGTSIQFEFDFLDDSGTAVTLPLFKPAALTSTASILVSIGPGVAFAQASAAPSTAAAGFGAISVPSGWTYYSYPVALVPNAAFAWTNVSTTACSWTAWIYGNN